MVFTKPVDFLEAFYATDDNFCAAARPESKKIFFGACRTAGERGWLNGELVYLDQSLDAICNFFENTSEHTHWCIGGVGLFDSELLFGLENYAQNKNIDGFVGLINIAPYEFAWYGEYVYSRHPGKFFPRGPLFMLPCIEKISLDDFYKGNLTIPDHFYGVLFQPPASDNMDFTKLESLI